MFSTNEKTISVLITLYNHEKYIEETALSALHQTLAPDEIIMIDDASTDGSVARAEKIVPQGVSLYKQRFNLGGATTMKGLAMCKGDYVAILNSDDLWHKDKLFKQLNYMEENPQCGAVFSRVALIDENGRRWPTGKQRIERAFLQSNRTHHEWLNYFFYQGNAFCASSALVRKGIFDELGLLNGKYIQLQDFEMWFRIAASGYGLHIVDEELTYYRVFKKQRNMSSYSLDNHSVFTYEFSKLLRLLWRMKTLDELRKVFPNIKFSKDADDSLTMFYLALLAHGQSTLHHKLFAVDTMAEWGGNESAMYMAQKCHSFGHKEYRQFIADSPIKGLLYKGGVGKCKLLIKGLLSRL